ncbi:HEAT repeat domain-containing protein [Streptomyces sp. NPDC006976]|uniref:HEAT repeat domain-containing protein n=1 Tax=Streptomyces sp. NPDC006976 TaxID=3154311 RepID=UPI0033CFEEE9
MQLLTGLAVDWDEEREIIEGADIAAWRAEASANSSDKLLLLHEEALATEQDEQRRQNLRGTRDWLAAGNPVNARDASMRSYDAVLVELPALYGLLDDENPRVRARAVYLLTWFPERADTSLPLLLDLASREDDAVAKATALVAVGVLGTTALPEPLSAALDSDDNLIRWAAATGVIQIAGSTAVEPDGPFLDRALAELTAAAAAPAPVPATEYNLGDLHRPHRRRPSRPSALRRLMRRSRRLPAVRQHVAEGVQGESGAAGPVPWSSARPPPSVRTPFPPPAAPSVCPRRPE